LKRKIDQLSRDRDAKFAAMKNEGAAAIEVNKLLAHYFAGNHLSLTPKPISGINDGVTFEILRGTQKAYNLSEGECSLIAFCYFLATIKDHIKDMIIYIDDPICSLDSNHIFFMFGAIKSMLSIDAIQYKQLFISTHNLEFLKYLKRINYPKNNNGGYIHLMTEKLGSSSIRTTPKHLSENTSEFILLFDQIYQCCSIQIQNPDYEKTYTLGNNLRRFMEIYFFFKFPCKNNGAKVREFFNQDNIAFLIYERITNEFSHQMGRMEQTMQPIDYIELIRLSRFIVTKIEQHDPSQLESLLDNIGESMASWRTIKGQPI